MKLLALYALFATAIAVHADYVFSLHKLNHGRVIDMTCTFNHTDPASNNLEIGKYTRFLHNSTYTVNVFKCHDVLDGSKCVGKVNQTTCDTGYEGEFCRHYGGFDKVVKCTL